MRFKTKSNFFIYIFLTFFPTSTSRLWADSTAPIDFHKSILPILKDSCFVCHVGGSYLAPYASTDPLLIKRIDKELGNALTDFPMGDHFPFPNDESISKQLSQLQKELSKNLMPPIAQNELGLGLPLSDQNRKILLKWVLQVKKTSK